MVDARKKNAPSFASLDALKRTAIERWNALGTSDWDEAFKAHPRIGEKKAEGPQSKVAHGWSTKEQAKVSEASQAVLDELREINRAYEERFGRIYIVCATGKSAEEMLAIAKERMQSDPDAEVRRAAEEQRRITELRLEKLVHG
jgi:OHCU decarboxylase